MLKNTPKIHKQAAGFTIVELMIATLVFSVILVVITTGVIHFTTAYYKGINSSTTQTLARSISDQISQSIQFSGARPVIIVGDGAAGNFASGTGVLCVGNQEYYYELGSQLTGASGEYALYRWTIPYNQCYSDPATYRGTATGFSKGKELLQPHMRLTQLDVNDIDGTTTNTFAVNLGIAFGDDDLFCAPASIDGSCDAGADDLTGDDFASPDLTCKSTTGSQFCAVVDLTTNAQSRLNFGG